MKLLTLLVLGLSFAASSAFAGSDCEYRISGTDQMKVTPSGITGKMSCDRKQTAELVETVTKAMKEANITDSVVMIGDLHSFWGVRQDLAKALAQSKDWDSAKGEKKAGAQGVITSELIPLFDPLFNKYGFRVSSANFEQMAVEDAGLQKFKDAKGKFPSTGKISLTVTKSSY
jgi:hypothetical protein